MQTRTLHSSRSDQKAKENYDTLVKMKKSSGSKSKAPQLSRSDINAGIVYLELSHNCCVRYFDGVDELRDLVSMQMGCFCF